MRGVCGVGGGHLRKTSPSPPLNLIAEVTHGNVQCPAGAYYGVVAGSQGGGHPVSVARGRRGGERPGGGGPVSGGPEGNPGGRGGVGGLPGYPEGGSEPGSVV